MHPPRSTGRITATGFVLLLVVAACAPPGGSLDPNAPKGEVITAETILATGATTVWDALRLTVKHAMFTTSGSDEPGAIRARGKSSIQLDDRMLVYVDYMPLSDLRLLQGMSVRSVERIEVLSGIEATTYFGTNAGDGVIHIITRTR